MKELKPFKCSVCDVKFANKQQLKKHTERVHEGMKPFKCSICDYKTAYQKSLKIHKEKIHEEIKKLVKCDFPDCGKTFFGYNAKRNCEYHQKKHLVFKGKKKKESDKEKNEDLTEANKTLQEQPNVPSEIKIESNEEHEVVIPKMVKLTCSQTIFN